MLPGQPGRGYFPAAREVNFGQPGRFFPTFSVHDFCWHIFFHSSEYNHNFGGRTAGKTVGGKFQSWVLDENLSGYLFTEHNPSLSNVVAVGEGGTEKEEEEVVVVEEEDNHNR